MRSRARAAPPPPPPPLLLLLLLLAAAALAGAPGNGAADSASAALNDAPASVAIDAGRGECAAAAAATLSAPRGLAADAAASALAAVALSAAALREAGKELLAASSRPCGAVDVARLLSAEGGASPDFCESDGWTALHYAAWNGRETTARLLVEAGADLSRVDLFTGYSALMDACARGHAAVARLLLARMGARALAIAEPGGRGRTAAELARESGMGDVADEIAARIALLLLLEGEGEKDMAAEEAAEEAGR